MHHSAYTYDHNTVTRYTFTSVGRKRIEKVVEFTDIGIENTFNLAFGDLLPNGSIDDTAISNNGDIAKVLATVISILKDFTTKNPQAHVAFTGSTDERIKLYARILKSYYSIFSADFKILAFIISGDTYKEVKFEPDAKVDYAVFLVKRIN
jgi:hypothetical protein